MKKLLKIAGIICLVCAVLLFILAGVVQEEAKGSTVGYGYMKDGVYIQTGSGTLGRNEKAIEEMEWMKGIAIICGIAGVGMEIGSTIIKEERIEY